MGKIKTGAARRPDTLRGGIAGAVVFSLAAFGQTTIAAPAYAQGRDRGGRRPPARRTTVRISIGKSESVRSQGNFVEVIVSDPDVADAIPLTDRSLSILGKKIGTARVSTYGEGRKLVGVYDVEVSYDTSRLGSELAQRFLHARFRVSSVNGRIMLGGTRAGCHDGRSAR